MVTWLRLRLRDWLLATSNCVFLWSPLTTGAHDVTDLQRFGSLLGWQTGDWSTCRKLAIKLASR